MVGCCVSVTWHNPDIMIGCWLQQLFLLSRNQASFPRLYFRLKLIAFTPVYWIVHGLLLILTLTFFLVMCRTACWYFFFWIVSYFLVLESFGFCSMLTDIEKKIIVHIFVDKSSNFCLPKFNMKYIVQMLQAINVMIE